MTARLRAAWRHLLETTELLERLLLDLLRHARLLDLLAVLVDLGLDLVVLTELLLDGLELLAKEVLALRLRHLLLDAVLDLAAELEDLELLAKEPRRPSRAGPSASSASRISCFSSTCRFRWKLTKSARRPGSSMAEAAISTSCGIGLPSCAARSKSETRLRMSASVSTSASGPPRWARRGRACTARGRHSTRRKRCTPSTSAFAVPSGSLSSCSTEATQPISYRSPDYGSCVSACSESRARPGGPGASPLRAP